jgi:hypothetical protein
MMLFSNERRSLLAKTIMDLAKILAATSFATTFFKELPVVVRMLMAVIFIGLLVGGFLVQPEKSEGKNG